MADRYLLDTATVATYYFDVSDAGPVDAGAFWTNDVNAFDGSLTTYAFSSAYGEALKGEGTNAPITGPTIVGVRARVHGYWSSDGIGTASYGSYKVLTTPTGGWTWQGVNDLEATIYTYPETSQASDIGADIRTNGGTQSLGFVSRLSTIVAGGQTAFISRVEVEVTYSSATTDGYLLEDGTGVLLLDTQNVIQSATASTAGYVLTSTIAPTNPVVPGNFLLLWISHNGTANNVTAVADTNTNTWVKVSSDVQNSRVGDWWYVQSAAGGTPTITITTTNFVTRAMVLREISGVATSSPIDVFAYAAVATSTAPSATATTTNANDLIVGAVGVDSTSVGFTLGAGYSNLSVANGGDFLSAAMESKNVTSAGSQTANFTINTAQGGIASIIAIKSASAGSPPPVGYVQDTKGFFNFF